MFSLSSVPQVNMRNKTAPVGVGKVVGGSSAVNGMMAIRGTTEDYDRWGGFFGKSQQSDWSFQGLLPYFQKALSFVPPDEAVTKSSNIIYDSKYWGSNMSGVYAAWPSYQYPGIKVQVEAYKEMGAAVAPDSGAGQTGVYWYPTFMDPKNVTRSYARTGHFSNLNRTNYHLVTQGKVNRILLNGTTAAGITFVSLKTPQNTNSTTSSNSTSPNTITVMARKEVILAAGAVHSPQILQLSGIGPKKVLDSANITAVVDLPGVGQNFQDHPVLPAGFVCKRRLSSNHAVLYQADFQAADQSLAQFLISQSIRRRATSTETQLSAPGQPRCGKQIKLDLSLLHRAMRQHGWHSLSYLHDTQRYQPTCLAKTTPRASPRTPTPPSSRDIKPRCSRTPWPSAPTKRRFSILFFRVGSTMASTISIP